LAAFGLGLIFGIALGPCSFAYMAPMLGIVFTLSTTRFYYGVLLLLFYGIGHCSVIIFAGTFTEIIQIYLNWNESSRGGGHQKDMRCSNNFRRNIFNLEYLKGDYLWLKKKMEA
jgi:hypothetical protein